VDQNIKREVIRLRMETGRCTEAIHLMIKDRMHVSRNTVHRILDRSGFLKKRNKRKWCHSPVERPKVEKLGDLDDSCNPGTWGYTSEIPEALVGSRLVKCMNSPFFTRRNIGVADAKPGLPFADPERFYDWLGSFVNVDDTIVLFGLTLDCCVLCTAQAIRFRGYDVRILLEATDTYDGGEESRRQTMDLVVSNWAKPMTIEEFRFANFGNSNVQQHE